MPRPSYSRRQDSVSTEITIMKRQVIGIGHLIKELPRVTRRGTRISGWISTLPLICSWWIGGGFALAPSYCSSQNTGVGVTQAPRNTYASLGSCHDFCMKGDYSLGIVQGNDCWCSNYAPNPAGNADDCNVPCPGYPYENCGNSKSGSYGYIVVNGKQPQGTAKPDASSSTRTSALPTSTSATASILPSVMTLPDGVRTVTLTASNGSPSPTKSDTPVPSSATDSGNFFSNAGRVAGVSTVIALVIIGGILFAFFFIRRRREKQGATQLASDSPTPDGRMGGSILPISEKRRSRSLSTLGLVGSGSDKQAPTIATNPASSNNPSNKTLNGGGASPGRVIDQRLDPTIWTRFDHDQAGRMSVRSFRDDQDYSRRVLRLANPDED